MIIDDLKNTWQVQAHEGDIDVSNSSLNQVPKNSQIALLKRIKLYRIIESIVFMAIIISLGRYIADGFSLTAPTLSAMVLNVFAIVGFVGCIGQIVLINNINFADPVSQVQKQLFIVCKHKLDFTKLLLASAPFYMAYVFIGFDVFWEVNLFDHLTVSVQYFYVVSSFVMLLFTLWLLFKLTHKHIETPWVAWVIKNIVGEQLVTMAKFVRLTEQKVE